MVLKVSNLSIHLKESKKLLLKPLSFELSSGQSLILLGESGSGKTMTCHAILRLLSDKFIVDGSISYKDKKEYDILKSSRKDLLHLYGNRIAFIPQNPMTALNPSLKVGVQMVETLLIHKKIKKSEAVNICKKALRDAGLADPDTIMDTYPYTLSGGMVQRVLIAMVLMTEAKLLITDEPTTELDVINRNSILREFANLKSRGTAILLVTHDFYIAEYLGGDLIILKDGHLVEQGRVDQILQNPQEAYTRNLLWAASYDRKIKNA